MVDAVLAPSGLDIGVLIAVAHKQAGRDVAVEVAHHDFALFTDARAVALCINQNDVILGRRLAHRACARRKPGEVAHHDARFGLAVALVDGQAGDGLKLVNNGGGKGLARGAAMLDGGKIFTF